MYSVDQEQAEMLARRLVQLPEDRKAVFRTTLEQEGIDPWQLPIVPEPETDSGRPLSFAQQRLWFVDQLESDSTMYNFFFALHIEGVLDVESLRQTLNDIIVRHEILRTNIVNVEGEGRQRVCPAEELLIPVIDIAHDDDPDDEKLNQYIIEESGKAFNLAEDACMMRVTLIRRSNENDATAASGKQKYIGLFSIHHIAFDAISMHMFVHELQQGYLHYCKAGTADKSVTKLLNETIRIQYADYASWQRQWLASDLAGSQFDYWQQQLADAPPNLNLSTTWRRPARLTYRGSVESRSLPTDLSQAIEKLVEGESITLYMVMLAAFNILLSRYSGQDDILVGTSIANRSRRETENLLGLFINILVMRNRVDGQLSFKQFLSVVQHVSTEAYSHQELPFDKLVDMLGVERQQNISPLFQVLFVLNNALDGLNVSLDDVDISLYPTPMNYARYDLTLRITQNAVLSKEQGLSCEIEYNTDLFSSEFIVAMLAQYEHLLTQIVADPDRAIADFSLLSPQQAERCQLTRSNTAYSIEAGADDFQTSTGTVQAEFERLTKDSPQKIALIVGQEELTYSELNRRANQLANRLIQSGIQLQQHVGILLPRSVDYIVSILGVLKAGAAYVPMDIQWPAERIRQIIDDSDATCLITAKPMLDSLSDCDISLLSLNDVATCSEKNPDVGGFAQHSAYLIYTSGSTGRPKGVVVEHRQLLSYVNGLLYQYDLAKRSFATVSSIATDLGNTAIFGALCSGGTLHVIDEACVSDATELSAYMSAHHVDVLKITPGHLQGLLLASENNADLLPEQDLIIGGEACPLSLVELVNRLAPACRIINHYGPTETTVGALTYEYLPETLDSQSLSHDVLPVGRPLPGYRAHIVDQHGSPCPQGVPGELVIGGAGVSRGYYNQQETNRQKYFTDRQGERYYRTGDRARLLANGDVEFLGRLDNQVKIRGYRIELGEIEALLQAMPQVGQVAVLIDEAVDDQSRNQLIACLVLENDSDLDVVKQQLQAAVPPYMIPNRYELLTDIPLTANGKIDRRQLLEQMRESVQSPNIGGREPRNELESQLLETWCDLLGKQGFSIDDNFFELGGDSILSLQLIARLKRVGIRLLPKQLFEHQTIALLAEVLQSNDQQSQQGSEISIEKAPEGAVIPLSFSQQRLWFLYQMEGTSSTYNIATGIAIRGDLDVDLVERSFDQLVKRHDSLRTVFRADAGIPSQQQHQPDDFTIERHTFSNKDRQAARDYADAFVRYTFDIEQDWLFRVHILQLDVQEHWLLVNIHHMIADGWSLQLLVTEFSDIYQQLQGDESAQLPPLTLQYSDFAYWQRHAGSEYYKKQSDYWVKKLAGVPGVISLPIDHPRPVQQTYRGEAFAVELDHELVEHLNQLAQRHHCTLYMVVLACWQVLLHRYSGQNDICVGTPIANRHIAELQPLVGFFANTLVIRGDLADDPQFADFLLQMKRTVIDAQAHQDAPFEQLVDAVKAPRDQSYSPLFQVLFAWGIGNMNTQNTLATSKGELHFSNIDSNQGLLDTGTSKFDMELALRENGERVSGMLSFNTDLFERSTIERMWRHYRQILSSVVDNDQYRVSQIPLLVEVEQQQYRDWNQTGRDYSAKGVEALFDAQAQKQMSKPAVRYVSAEGEETSCSYAALNAESNRLAQLLQSQKIGSGSLVGICQRRGVSLLTSVLAVMKSGAAYVPLDPGYPAERIHYMLADTSLALCLTDQSVLDSGLLDPLAAERVLNLDTINLDEQPATAPSCSASAEDLAYLIYTSGSTGQPKGVEVTRANLSNFIQSMQELLQLDETDRLLAVTSLSFDIATLELYLPLVTGAEVVLGDDMLGLDGKRLNDLLATGITLMQATPASWKLLLASGWQHEGTQHDNTQYDAWSNRFTALCGGEAFPVELANTLLEQPIRLWNMYGPTETTVWSAAYELSAEPEGITQSVPIGRPIANTALYVLDDGYQPVPIGVAGELYIGGAGVARGYRGREDLTSERFIETEYGRLYRTGDLARYRADGVLECLGRIDTQVKVRGYRIELGEIEQCLLQHIAVSEAVVQPVERLGEPVLVGYVVLSDSTLSDETVDESVTSQLTAHVATLLPAYMVPTLWVELKSLPLTPNGKVNRKVLPEPEVGVQRTEYVAPRNETEAVLCEIWQDVLTVERIGVHDNFFELGGHSLLATQLVARCQDQFYVKLPLGELFKSPTIASVSGIIDEAVAGSGEFASTINEESLDAIDDLLAEYEEANG